ncbi:hypothetical protein [Clostridium massiliamazoniense]|uniref:hypothetical protein n=1 Tax=Clostridium massiliamazoniense TaxID=1347366 RepID=UPI000B057642|nr:hypothetical protein [Clostridium massiliamazoniense]
MYDFFYEMCFKLGRNFGFGALEGGIIYGGIIAIVFIKAVDLVVKEKKKKAKE